MILKEQENVFLFEFGLIAPAVPKCLFSQFCSNFQKFRGLLQVEKCDIFWEISHIHWGNFSIVCIILSSAHIKSFIYFSLSVPVVLK